MSRFVLITPNADFERLASAGHRRNARRLHVFQADYLPEGPEDILRQMVGEPPEVLILGPGLPVEGSLKLAVRDGPSVPGNQCGPGRHGYPRNRAAGYAGRRPGPAGSGRRPDTIRVMLERASLAAAGRRRGLAPQATEHADHGWRGRVIAVMSPKGGVGKTTVATNLAVGLGKAAPMSVVIVDLDLQFGDVASGLLLEPEFTITDAVLGAASQDSMVLKTYLTVHPAGIYALCAPRSPVEMDRITAAHVSHLLEQLRQEFRYIVVDTAPGLGEHVLATLEQATDAVWICGMDVPSIRGMRTGFQILDELNLVPEHRHIVLNMADRRAGLTLKDVEATVGAPVDVVLPRSKNLPFSTNKGVPILQDGSRDPAAKGLRQLVDRFKPDWEARPHKQLHRRAVVQ